MSKDALIAKYEALPAASQKQIEAFIEFLSARFSSGSNRPVGPRFNFGWAGGLADLQNQFTAVELQHHINELR